MAIANRTGGQILISILGKNISSGAIDIYQTLITSGEPLNLSIDPLSSGEHDWITVRDRGGQIIGQTRGDEVEPNGEISFSVYEDFDYLAKKSVYGCSKNKLLCVVNGEAFYNKEDVIVPIGTNGTDKKDSIAKVREMNMDYKNLFYFEGGYVKNVGTADENGEHTFRKNPFESSFNRTHKTFCFEIKTENGVGYECKTMPIVAKKTTNWTEGDLNTFELTAQRGCDVWSRDDFWTEVYKKDIDILKYIKFKPTTTVCREENVKNPLIYSTDCELLLKEIYVDYIVNATDITQDDGEIGDVACIINESGDITIKTNTKEDGWVINFYITSALRQGVRIKSNKLKTKEEVKDVNVFCGILSNNKAIRFSTNPNENKYYAKVYDFDKTSGNFEEYLSS